MQKLSKEKRAEIVTIVRYYAIAASPHFGFDFVIDWLDEDIEAATGDADSILPALQNVRKAATILHRHRDLLDPRNWKGNA